MTVGEAVNAWGSVIALVGSLTFVTAYTLVARWWRSPVGRLLVTKALAIAAFMVISIAISALDADPEALRILRGVLAGLFGALMFCQAGLVIRTQIKGARDGVADDT